MAKHRVRDADELQRACDRAAEGDTILIHGGLYDRPAKLEQKRGIAIVAGDRAWISGGESPEPQPGVPPKPSVVDHAFLVIDDCERIVVDGLNVREFWPTIFFVKDTSFLAIRNCALRHGTYAVFAKGKTSHLLLDRNEWRQDDSAGHLLWSEIDWARAHGDEGEDGRYSYFNGGFLSTKGIRGNVIVRRNRIMDAYNGIRMKFGDVVPRDDEGGLDAANANVHIVDNDFIRIRDNPTEPEGAAYNWHVRHNRLVDCHSWFSFDGVAGGYWYYYGNTGRFTSRQGLYGTSGHTMGRVLKLSYETMPPGDRTLERVPVFPWYVFNNSWHLRCPLIGGANEKVPGPDDDPGEGPDFTANLDFFNNAFAWCDATQYGPWVCEPIDLLLNFDFARSARTHFDYNICDRGGYFAWLRDWGEEVNGVAAARPLFEDAGGGRFRLAPGSEARDTGRAGDVMTPKNPAALKLQAGQTVSRGAFQDYGLIEVPKLEAAFDRLLKDIESALDPRVGGGPSVKARAPVPKVAGVKGKRAGKR